MLKPPTKKMLKQQNDLAVLKFLFYCHEASLLKTKTLKKLEHKTFLKTQKQFLPLY
jgi:hypothetical protein